MAPPRLFLWFTAVNNISDNHLVINLRLSLETTILVQPFIPTILPYPKSEKKARLPHLLL